MLQRPAQRRHRAEQRQPVDAQFVRRFRVQLEKRPAEKIFVEPTHTPESAEHAAKMQVSGNATLFRRAVWQKNHPNVFFACFFETRLHAALKFPIRLSAEAASEKSAKNRFPGLTRAIDRPFAPIEITSY